MPVANESSSQSHSAAGLTPERSLTQRMDALQRANEIRTRRATLKRDLKAGRTKIHGLLLDPPEYLQTAKVFDLLLAVPKYGRVKVNRILTHCRISPSKTIGGLSERQRNELVSYLPPIDARAPQTPVLVITGPSGVGKGTLIKLLLERCHGLQLSVSATTREPREGEVNGREYHFLSRQDFDQRVDNGEFIEHAEYAGNRYGTLRSELERPADGIVLEIEIQGARQVRRTLPEAYQVFIAPPSLDALRERLVGRASDSEEQIARRLEVAPVEMDAQEEFRKVVVNADLDVALEELVALAATMSAPDEPESP